MSSTMRRKQAKHFPARAFGSDIVELASRGSAFAYGSPEQMAAQRGHFALSKHSHRAPWQRKTIVPDVSK